MGQRSLISLVLLTATVALSLLAGCANQPQDKNVARNPQGQLVDPQTGIPLPGQGGAAGAGGGY